MVKKFLTNPKMMFLFKCCDVAILSTFGVVMSYTFIQVVMSS